MRVGVTLYAQAYEDWDRYEADEHGETVPPVDGAADAGILADEMELGRYAESLGFDSLWTVEHHVTPYTLSTNPLQWLSYFAGATSRVDLGTMVVVIPWHHPLRVAEDIILLQHVLGTGRTPYIGFGRGAAQREFRQLGIDMNHSRQLFHEGVEIIKLALTQEKFSYHGEHFHFDDITIRPRPLDAQALIDNFHFSWGSPTSAPVGAAHGLKPLIIPQKALAEYHGDLTEFGRARAEVGLPPASPRMHLLVQVAETEEEARALAEVHIAEYTDSASREYELGKGHFTSIKGYEHYASQKSDDLVAMRRQMAQRYLETHLWGTPEQVLAKIEAIADAFHPEEFMLAFKYGSMSLDAAKKSMDLFAREVLPAVRAIPVRAPIVYEAALA